MTAVLARDDIRGVDLPCRRRVLLTADDICVKVFVYHDLQRERRSLAALEYESKDRDALEGALGR